MDGMCCLKMVSFSTVWRIILKMLIVHVSVFVETISMVESVCNFNLLVLPTMSGKLICDCTVVCLDLVYLWLLTERGFMCPMQMMGGDLLDILGHRWVGWKGWVVLL